jgi:hypothetical protein
VPDISADADLDTGFAVGVLVPQKGAPPQFIEFPVGGTSVAAPLVAGLVTTAQQGQPGSFGFLNPAIYALAGTSSYFATLPLNSRSPALWRGVATGTGGRTLITFDNQDPSYTRQVTLRGYDNMTGAGTPDGPKFIAGLRKLKG